MRTSRAAVATSNGQNFPGLVVAVEDNVVILRNQEFDRIGVRIDRIDAVASH